MRNITRRIRAAVGALGILAFASPLAAQTHPHRTELRVAAQWVGRSQGAPWARMGWRRAGAWRMGPIGWPRGYAAGYAWRGYAIRRPWIRRGALVRFVGPRRVMRRPWRRGWVGWRARGG